MKDENVVQKVLGHEITKIIGIVVFLWGIITQVIIPLNNLQIQQAEIRSDITKVVANYESMNTTINTLSIAVSVLQSRLDNLKIK